MAEVTCPKCAQKAQEHEQACPRCGLLRVHWPSFSDRPPAHPTLDPLWQLALDKWDDEKRHAAMAQVVSHDFAGLSALAQRYSAVLRQRPGDEIAKSSLDRVVQMALGAPLPSRAGAADKAKRGGKVAGAVLGVLLMVLSAYFFSLLFRR